MIWFLLGLFVGLGVAVVNDINWQAGHYDD